MSWLICIIIFIIIVTNFLYMFFDYKIKQLDEEIAKLDEEIARLEEQKKALEESEWGWTSKFLKIEFIDVKLRNEFDTEVKKIKAQTKDLADASSAICHLVESLDSNKIKVPNKDKLTQSILDYLREV